MHIEVNDISKTYRTGAAPVEALSHVSLQVERGQFVCIIGGSGCGKSTLLNSIAGFELPDSGSLAMNGAPIAGPGPNRLMIFQNYGLLPWRTAEGNVAFALENRKDVPQEEKRRRIANALRTVGLAEKKDAFPGNLSGGQRQRVAVARVLAAEPEVVLMDEPFGALDAITKMHLQDVVRDICASGRRTAVMVTHDIDEAIYLADRIVVMKPNPGHIFKDLKVELPHPRNRSNPEFLQLRARLLRYLSLASGRLPEYSI